MQMLKRKIALLCALPILAFTGAPYMSGQTSSDSPMSPFLTSPAALASFCGSYRDYSSGGANYSVLNGIDLKATSVKFVGNEKIKEWGTELTFRKFEVLAPITVQTSRDDVSRTFDTALARYTLSVAPDPKDVVRQNFLQQIKSSWDSKSPEELHDYEYLPSEKFLWRDSGQYVLYSEPDGELPNATYLLYTSGKVIRLTFVGFQSGDGWGGLSTFLYDNLLFKFSNTEIRPGDTPDSSPRQFLALYSSGFFKKPPNP